MGAQPRFIMADSFKRISGGAGGVTPRFLQSKGIKMPKSDAKTIKINNVNLYCTNPLDYCNFQQEAMAHPGTH